jgi:hypothetical protein
VVARRLADRVRQRSQRRPADLRDVRERRRREAGLVQRQLQHHADLVAQGRKHIIAYTTRDGGTYDIVTLDLDAKATTRITQNEGSNEEPAFSPNGRAIAFARAGQGVFIANADGTGKAVKVWSGSATGVDWGPAPAP